jgi:hypothetical protein
MTESAHSLRNTILLLLEHLELDPARIIARMARNRRFGRISVQNRTCFAVHPISEAGAKRLGIALPAFALHATARQMKSPFSGPTVIVHVRTYRDGAGKVIRYAEVDTAESLLKAVRPLTARIFVPDSDGMVPKHFRRGDLGAIGEHPADG